jgi:hypothetical protein
MMVEFMPQSEMDQLTEDLDSNDPKRVASALETLERAPRLGRGGALPMPRPDCLDAFGEHVPPEALTLYVSLLVYYPSFEPAPGLQRWRAMVDAVLEYGRGEGMYDVALAIKCESFARYVVEDVMQHIQHSEVDTPDKLLAVHRLVDDLLDDATTTRQATVDALRSWVMTDHFPEIVAAVRPRLDDAERAILDEAARDA